MKQIVSGRNMNIKLPDEHYDVVFNQALEMGKEKKRRVSLTQATLHIIKDWKEKCQPENTPATAKK